MTTRVSHYSYHRYAALVVLMTLVFGNVAHSQNAAAPDGEYIYPHCMPTRAIVTRQYPGYTTIMPANHLSMPPGKAVMADGQPVRLIGRVFDRNCVPLSEAKIEIWQPDPYGVYRYATKAALPTPDPVFSGSGRTTSDNLGYFQFDTLYPGPETRRLSGTNSKGKSYRYTVVKAPHINIRVTHADIRPFTTTLFFAGDGRNEEDAALKRLSADAERSILMNMAPDTGGRADAVRATIDIILPQIVKFRSF